MAALFPVEGDKESLVPGVYNPPVDPSQHAFSSFNAASFISSQQQPSSIVQPGLRGAHMLLQIVGVIHCLLPSASRCCCHCDVGEDLKRAIDYYLPSSSDDSDADDLQPSVAQPNTDSLLQQLDTTVLDEAKKLHKADRRSASKPGQTCFISQLRY